MHLLGRRRPHRKPTHGVGVSRILNPATVGKGAMHKLNFVGDSTDLQFYAKQFKEAKNAESVAESISTAFEELYKIVFESDYPPDQQIDLRRGQNGVPSSSDRLRVERGRVDLTTTQFTPILIRKATDWSGLVKAPQGNTRTTSFITVRCYLRLVLKNGTIKHAYMYPMFMWKTGQHVLQNGVNFAGEDPPESKGATYVDFAVETRRPHEEFRLLVRADEKDNPGLVFQNGYVSTRDSIRDLKQLIVAWCGEGPYPRRELDVGDQTETDAAQSAGRGEVHGNSASLAFGSAAMDPMETDTAQPGFDDAAPMEFDPAQQPPGAVDSDAEDADIDAIIGILPPLPPAKAAVGPAGSLPPFLLEFAGGVDPRPGGGKMRRERVLDIPETLALGGMFAPEQKDVHYVEAVTQFSPKMSARSLNNAFKWHLSPLQFSIQPKGNESDVLFAVSIKARLALRIEPWSAELESSLKTAADLEDCNLVQFKAFLCDQGEAQYVATVTSAGTKPAAAAFSGKPPDGFMEQLITLEACLAKKGATYPDMSPYNIGVTGNGNLRLMNLHRINKGVATYPAIAHWADTYEDVQGAQRPPGAVDLDAIMGILPPLPPAEAAAASGYTAKVQKALQTKWAFLMTAHRLYLRTPERREAFEALFGRESFREGVGYKSYKDRRKYLTRDFGPTAPAIKILDEAHALEINYGWSLSIPADSV